MEYMNIDQKSNHIITDSKTSLAVARDLGENISPPFTIELIGDLGGGKTTFVKGLAKGLGIDKAIVSPTFTIRRSYLSPNGVCLDHYDLYRLDEDRAVLEELRESCLDSNTIVAVEWGDNFEQVLPKDRLIIEFKFATENTRELIISSTGLKSANLIKKIK